MNSAPTTRVNSVRARRVAGCAIYCCAGVLLSCASTASAHPVPAAQARLNFAPNGQWELRIACDVAALVMQATPGHLGASANELRALDEDELQARIDDARLALEHYLELWINGARQKPARIDFPTPDEIRAATSEHGEDPPDTTIVLSGSPDAAPETCALQFPASLGRVRAQIRHGGELHFDRELAPGVVATLELQHPSPVEWTGWILAGLALAYLIRLIVAQRGAYSRSTNTGQ